MINCVYLLINKRTEKIYVGSTGKFKQRIQRHFRELLNGDHHCRPMQEDYNTSDDIEVKMVWLNTREEAYELEQQLLDEFHQDGILYNVGCSVKGGDNLTRNPRRQEIIEKMSESLRHRYTLMSVEQRREVYGKAGEKNGMFGRNHTEESRKRMSECKIGVSTSLKGVKWSEERKMASRAFFTHRDYRGDKNPFHGKSHSTETKEKLRKANLGKKPPNQVKVRIDGVVYESLKEASRNLGVPVPTVFHRVHNTNPKFTEWQLMT